MIKKVYNDNKLVFDIVIAVLVVISLYYIPSFILRYVLLVVSDSNVASLIANFSYGIILFLMFYKSIIEEFKIFIRSFKKSITKSFKWYFLSICLMVIFNLLLNVYLGGISDNETLVREYIMKYPLLAFFSVSIVAPITEELIFRKSIMRITTNKWLGSTICGLLFGLAHVIEYVSISPLKLLYLLPYASLGFGFAAMDYETKSTFTSICYHSMHNTFSFILILVALG